MNVSAKTITSMTALLLAGALLAGCATPRESRDMGDNSDGLYQGDQPEESAGAAGNNTQGDAITGPEVPGQDEASDQGMAPTSG